jgi:hypothetical protein
MGHQKTGLVEPFDFSLKGSVPAKHQGALPEAAGEVSNGPEELGVMPTGTRSRTRECLKGA